MKRRHEVVLWTIRDHQKLVYSIYRPYIWFISWFVTKIFETYFQLLVVLATPLRKRRNAHWAYEKLIRIKEWIKKSDKMILLPFFIEHYYSNKIEHLQYQGNIYMIYWWCKIYFEKLSQKWKLLNRFKYSSLLHKKKNAGKLCFISSCHLCYIISFTWLCLLPLLVTHS